MLIDNVVWNEEMEKKDSSTEGESGTVSPDVQAFFDLVDREGRRRRLELLNKKNEASSAKRPANNVVPWQPKFEMEDFELSSERVEFSSAKPCYEGDDGCLGRGIKRKSELTPPPSIHKKYASTRFEFDLNKSSDSFQDIRVVHTRMLLWTCMCWIASEPSPKDPTPPAVTWRSLYCLAKEINSLMARQAAKPANSLLLGCSEGHDDDDEPI